MEYQAIELSGATCATPRFTVSRDALLPMLELMAKGVVERRNTLPILANIRIDASPNGEVRLTGTDLDMELSVTLSADSVDQPGATTVSAATLRDIVKKAAKGSYVHFNASDGRAAISHGRAQQSIVTLPVDDFPSIAPMQTSAMFELPAGFVDDLAMIAPFASKDGDRYYLNGVAIEARDLGDGERLYCVASDAVTVSRASYVLPDGAQGLATSIIPSKAIAALRALAKLTGDVCPIVEISNSKISVTMGGALLTAKLIDGDFIQWHTCNPTGELSGLMLPELAPRLASGRVEALKKAVLAPLYWEMADMDGEPRALITAPSIPHWQAILCGTKEPVYPQGYYADGDCTVEADGVTYPVAVKSGRIHLSAETVAALCGPVDPSTHVYIPEMTFWRGKCVAVDGVATDEMPDGYWLNPVRGKGKARYAVIIPMPEGMAAPVSAPDELAAPQDATETPAPDVPATPPADEPEIAPQDEKNGLVDDAQAEPDPLSALIARMDALEKRLECVSSVAEPIAAIADVEPLPADPRALAVATVRREVQDANPIGGKRTAAHVRAVRLAWKARTDARKAKRSEASVCELKNAYFDMWKDISDKLDVASAKRRRAVLKARDMSAALRTTIKQRAHWKLQCDEFEQRGLDMQQSRNECAADAETWEAKARAAIAEGERLRKVAYQMTGHIQTVSERLDRAEAILRGQGPVLSIVPPSLAVAA